MAMRAQLLLADATSKPSHCHAGMRGVLGHAAIDLSTACNAIGEQEAGPRRLRRNCAPGYPSGAPKACTSSVGLPSPHKQPKETCPRLIWPYVIQFPGSEMACGQAGNPYRPNVTICVTPACNIPTIEHCFSRGSRVSHPHQRPAVENYALPVLCYDI